MEFISATRPDQQNPKYICFFKYIDWTLFIYGVFQIQVVLQKYNNFLAPKAKRVPILSKPNLFEKKLKYRNFAINVPGNSPRVQGYYLCKTMQNVEFGIRFIFNLLSSFFCTHYAAVLYPAALLSNQTTLVRMHA